MCRHCGLQCRVTPLERLPHFASVLCVLTVLSFYCTNEVKVVRRSVVTLHVYMYYVARAAMRAGIHYPACTEQVKLLRARHPNLDAFISHWSLDHAC